LRELFRVVARGGTLVFQLLSHLRLADDRQPVSPPMPEEAYRASIRVESAFPDFAAPGAEVVLAASVTNTSRHAWSEREAGPIRLGNHWLAGLGHAMLIQDDGRTLLPPDLAAGETCHVLSDEASAEEDPEPLSMYGIHRQVVEQLIRDDGGTVVHLETDERCGREWVGYRYFVRKT
jgi:hypothetical protein